MAVVGVPPLPPLPRAATEGVARDCGGRTGGDGARGIDAAAAAEEEDEEEEEEEEKEEDMAGVNTGRQGVRPEGVKGACKGGRPCRP